MQDKRCFAKLTKFTQEHSNNDGTLRNYTPKELCDLIREISTYFQTTMIVVDGLDEITNDHRAEVLSLLTSLNTPKGSIKTLFASRKEIDIAIELQDYVQMFFAARSSDLRLYIACEIERSTIQKELRIRDPSLKYQIMQTFVDGAEGMYGQVHTSLL